MAKTKMLRAPGNSQLAKVMRYLRYVIWTIGIFFFLIGVKTAVFPKQPVLAEPKAAVVMSDAAQSFAQAFTRAYLSFDAGKAEAHVKSLESFVSKDLLSDAVGLDVRSAKSSFRVMETLPWSATKISESRSDVIIKAEIEEKKDAGSTIFTRYVQVPIAWNGQGFYIDDFPTFVPNPYNAGKGEATSFPRDNAVPDEIKKTVSASLEDFLKSYGSSSPSQLKYFMLDGKELGGYDGTFTFSRLRNVQVMEVNTTSGGKKLVDQVKAFSDVEWKDASNITYVNHFTIAMKFKDDRWYIEQLSGGYKP